MTSQHVRHEFAPFEALASQEPVRSGLKFHRQQSLGRLVNRGDRGDKTLVSVDKVQLEIQAQ
jgi:hypothetical protein